MTYPKPIYSNANIYANFYLVFLSTEVEKK
jgi:hypothetical protein